MSTTGRARASYRQMYLRCCVLALLLAACTTASRTPAPVRPAAEPIDRVIESVMAKLHVPGAAVAVVRDGRVVTARGYGRANVEWPSPVTTRTRFQIASSTKIFTATLVMVLAQDGRLVLDRPVSAYLPDAPAAWKDLTVRQLAAHAGGLPDDVTPATDTVTDAYAAIRALPLRFAPGSQARYGTGDFIVLARVLEVVGGQPFEDLLRARVFEPLGLTCTTFEHAAQDGPVRTADTIADRAPVYRWVKDRQRIAWFFYPVHTYASGGAFSCVDDIARWAVAIDRATLLTAESERAAAAAFRIGDRDAGFGVVFSVGTLRGRQTYGHSGGPALADVLRVPSERLTVIVLANQQRLFPNLAARIASELLPPAPPAAERADDDPATTAKLRRVAEQIANGTPEPGAFTAALQTEGIPVLREWGPIQAASFPALDRFVFVGQTSTDAGRVRTYRASYGAVDVRWTFTLDGAGAIADVDFTIE